MRIIIISLLLLLCAGINANAQPPSIYSFKIDSVAGTNKIDFSKFQGKKILIVNAASSDSNFTKQYKELIQLYQLYKDKLVIVVAPSNSFGNETGTNQQIASKYVQNATYKFPVAAKMNVTNPQIHALYKWLTRKADNGLVDTDIKRPFYKYLVDQNGKLVASFNDKVTPMHTIIQTAVNR